MDRDSIDTFVQDDHITFMLDTFNDERRAFQFRVNPQTVVFVGFSDNFRGFDQDPLRVDLTQSDRTIFVKLGYAWIL